MQGPNDFLGGSVAAGSDDFDRPFEPELVSSGAGRLDDPIGEEEDDVSLVERDRAHLRESGLLEDAERQTGALQLALDRAVGAEDEAGGVAGVRVDEGPSGRVEPGKEEGDEAALVDVGVEGAVGQGQDVADPLVGQRQGPEVGAGGRHQQGGPEAVAADVADDDPQAAVGEGDVVEVVAAGLLGRDRRPGDVEAGEARRRGREEPLLDLLRDPEPELEPRVLGAAALLE